MKVVGKIFSIIGGILGILSGICFLIYGIALMLLAIPEVKDIFTQAMDQVSGMMPAYVVQYMDYLIAGAMVSGIVLIVLSIFAFIAGGLSLKCHNKKNYVPTIVLNVLAGFQVLAILGAIFGLIFDKD